jgi:hypothetical protein
MANNPKLYIYPLVKIYNQATGTWKSLPTPSEYSGQSSTLVDSARNTKGYVVANVIRSDVASISMTWNYLSVEDYRDMAKLFEPLYNGAFINYVSFWDSVKGDFNGQSTTTPNDNTNKKMYCGDRKVSVAHICLDSSGKPIGYEGVQLDLVEV